MSTALDVRPGHLRRNALSRLLEHIGGDGLTYQVYSVDGAEYYGDLQATADLGDYTTRFEGARRLGGSVSADDPEVRVVRGAVDPHSDGFARFGEDRPLGEFVGTTAWKMFYEPFEISDHLRTMFFADGQVIGYLAALRRGGDRFEAREQELANRLIPSIYDDLHLAQSIERAQTDGGSLHLIVDEAWRVVFASELARVWLTRRRRELLRDWPSEKKRRLIDGMQVSSTRLAEGGGRWHYVALSVAPNARRNRWQSMSETQRRIAELAATGLTNEEIGLVVELSASTVKYHLTTIRDLLGIESRTAVGRLAQTSAGN